MSKRIGMMIDRLIRWFYGTRTDRYFRLGARSLAKIPSARDLADTTPNLSVRLHRMGRDMFKAGFHLTLSVANASLWFEEDSL